MIPINRSIDALTVSCEFAFPEPLKLVLDAAKLQAREDAGGLACLIEKIPDVPGGPWYVKAKGRGKYQYVLENSAFYLELTTWANLPALVVQFKAETLHEEKPEDYRPILEALVRFFIGSNADWKHKVSRFDLALDFQKPRFKIPEMAEVITRARERVLNFLGDRANTLTLGKRHAALQAQIYCKSEELLKSGKFWMRDVWRSCPDYDETLPVWRFEVRWFRVGLRNLDVHTLDDALGSLGDLVALSVGENNGTWLRVADPDSRGKQTQTRPAAAWWVSLVRALKSGLPFVGRKRRGTNLRHSYSVAVERAGAHLAKAAAIARAGGFKTPLSCGTFFSLAGEKYDGMLSRKRKTWADRVNANLSLMRGHVHVPEPVNVLAG